MKLTLHLLLSAEAKGGCTLCNLMVVPLRNVEKQCSGTRFSVVTAVLLKRQVSLNMMLRYMSGATCFKAYAFIFRTKQTLKSSCAGR